MATQNVVADRVRKAIEFLAKYISISAVYLFGSQVDGRADEWSDVDIAVFTDDLEHWEVTEEFSTTLKIQEELGYDMEFHFFNADEWRNPERASFAEWVIKNGQRLN